MELVVLTIMILVALNYLLKLSWHGTVGMIAVSVVMALFVASSWSVAAEQSKTQIADWLQQPDLMLDTSVVLTIDVFFQIAFCILMGRKISGSGLTRWERIALQLTLWIPGLLIVPVLFSALVEAIFSFPGHDFAMLAWTFAAVIAVGGPAMALLSRNLIPEKDLRLDLIFMISGLIALLGVVATVNGRTAAAGTNRVEWDALGAIFAILAVGAAAGFIINKKSIKRKIKQIK